MTGAVEASTLPTEPDTSLTASYLAAIDDSAEAV